MKPYFTPEIEKGAQWFASISSELKDNIDCKWIHFEAGALSNNLEEPHVCPILFGMKSTDLEGPLRQLQTTEFDKEDMRRLLGNINKGLDISLPEKTFERSFDKMVAGFRSKDWKNPSWGRRA